MYPYGHTFSDSPDQTGVGKGKGKANVEYSNTDEHHAPIDLSNEYVTPTLTHDLDVRRQEEALEAFRIQPEYDQANVAERLQQAENRKHVEEMEEYRKNNGWEYEVEPIVKKETLTEEVNRIFNDSKVPKLPDKVEEQLNNYRLVMETTILPEVERYSEKLGIHLEKTEVMTQRYEEHISKYAELLTKINESSRFKKILIGTATAFSIGYFIYKIGLYKELPKLLSSAVSTIGDVVGEMKISSKLPTPSVPEATSKLISDKWLHSPIVSPTELVLLGSVLGLGILAFRLALKVKRFIKK
jgi:hypothetical protein